jgi:hypothetical protein
MASRKCMGSQLRQSEHLSDNSRTTARKRQAESFRTEIRLRKRRVRRHEKKGREGVTMYD